MLMAIQSKNIKISVGKSVYSNKIIQKEVTIKGLFKQFSKPEIQQEKDGKYFIFASFNKNIRTAKNIDEFYGATIDLDNTSLTLKDIRHKFKKYQHCIYTTFNHKAKGKGNRYRLVLPYKIPVNVKTHIETMHYLMHLLGANNVDLSSKALSRPMYLPATHESRKTVFEHYKTLKGFLFNPNSAKIREAVSAVSFELGENKLAESQIPFDVNKDVAEGERNDALAKAVGKFINTGIAISELFSMAEAWNQSKLNPPLDSKEVKTIVQSIINSHIRNHNDLEWGYDEIISRIEKSKEITKDYEHIIDMVVASKSKKNLKPSQLQLILNSLAKKSKIGKRILLQEIETKEIILSRKEEEETVKSFANESDKIRNKFKDWAYIGSDDRIYNTLSGEYYKKEAFASMFANPNIEGSLIGLIMKYDLITKVSKLEFDPAKPDIYIRDKIKYVNTYIPPDIFPLPGDISPVLNYFKYLIENKYERDILLDFIAHLVQKPGEKIRWMPVIKGHKGIGKTFIAEKILLPLIGWTNFGKVNNDLIKADFNAWQLDKQLVVFEELNIGSNRKEKEAHTDRLKSFITDNILTAHRKGLDPYDTINKANSLGFTNKDDAIIISADERRFCMIRTMVKPKSPKYYTDLAKFIDDNISAMYYYFMERDIEKFSVSIAPDSTYTKEIKSASLGWQETVLTEILTDNKSQISKGGCATYRQIAMTIRAMSSGRYKSYADDLLSPGSHVARELRNALISMGFTKYHSGKGDGRVRVEGKSETAWIVPDDPKGLLKKQSKAVIKRLNAVKIKENNWDE